MLVIACDENVARLDIVPELLELPLFWGVFFLVALLLGRVLLPYLPSR